MARITIKGIPHDAGVAPGAPLSLVLQEQLGLTGARSEARKPAAALEESGGCRATGCEFSGMLHG
jgi:hypothetical protein